MPSLTPRARYPRRPRNWTSRVTNQLFIIDDEDGFSGVRGRTCLDPGGVRLSGRLLDDAIDPFDEHVQRQPFADEVGDAQRAGLVFLDLRRSSTQDNHRRLRIDGTNLLQHGQPVHFRHPQVENRHTGIVLAEEIQPLEAAGSRMDVIAMTRQDGLQKVAIHAVVIDDKNFDHARVLSDIVL